MTLRARGAALEWLEQTYRGPCREQDDVVTVGAVSALAIQRDPERVSLTIINLSADTVWLSPFNTGVTPRGIRLSASGGWMSVTLVDDAVLPTIEWHAIGAVGAQDIYWLAVRRETITQPEGE